MNEKIEVLFASSSISCAALFLGSLSGPASAVPGSAQAKSQAARRRRLRANIIVQKNSREAVAAARGALELDRLTEDVPIIVVRHDNMTRLRDRNLRVRGLAALLGWQHVKVALTGIGGLGDSPQAGGGKAATTRWVWVLLAIYIEAKERERPIEREHADLDVLSERRFSDVAMNSLHGN